MEEVLARIFQFSVALIGAFTVALWFALVIWTYRDSVLRSRNPMMQVFSTLIVVLFFIPGVVIYMLLRPRETLDEKQQRWIEEEYLAQELDDITICPSCNHVAKDEWIYCPTCRYQLRRACQSCGRLVESGWAVCAFCGAAQREAEEEAAVSPAIPGREVAVRPESWIAAVRETVDSRRMTADGSGVLLESEGPYSNGTVDSDYTEIEETGELPAAEAAALESGKRSTE